MHQLAELPQVAASRAGARNREVAVAASVQRIDEQRLACRPASIGLGSCEHTRAATRHRLDAEAAVAVFVQLGEQRRWYSLRAHVPAFYRDTVAFVIGQAQDALTNATR